MFGAIVNDLGRLLLGPRIADRREHEERIGPVRGVAVLGLDALASAAYGPEALLTALLVLGAASARWALPLSLVIVGVLVIVSLSYRQTIAAYPGGGGSYTVARENLGPRFGILAGASLAVDYILNVAVAISAGVGAIVSVVPALLPWTLWLCLGLLALLTMLNLRGIRTAGTLLAIPACVFVVCLFATIVLGAARTAAAGGDPEPVIVPPRAAQTVASASPWLLLHAFANGCTAMTGIEAVSNGVPLFRSPSVLGARRTLAAITAILVVLLVGVAGLCHAYVITATPPGQTGYESVLSQMVAAVAGRGLFYHVSLMAVVAVLALSANTSFADFPRLCRLLALDHHLPEPFAHKGRRLVFSHGIVVLSILAGLLLVVFSGVTQHLIPLFAIGALSSFTLSQAGMVMHWRRRLHERHARAKAMMNATGALATGATLVVVAVAKLAEGAWISVFVVIGLYSLFVGVSEHYAALERKAALPGPLDLRPLAPPHVIVPIRRWDRAAQRALRFAVTLSPDVVVLQVLTSEHRDDDLSPRWTELIERPAAEAGVRAPRLVILESEFRQLFAPILDYVRCVEAEDPSRDVVVVVPQIVEPRWYHALLHNNTAALLKTLLTLRGGPRIVVASTPWHLEEEERRPSLLRYRARRLARLS